MPSFTRTATIDRAPAQVFAVLDDLQAAPRWMPAIKKIEVQTPDAPVGVGFKWRETRRVMGVIPMRFTIEVAKHQRPKLWGIGFTDGKLQTAATFELEPAGRGTSITLTETCEDLVGKPKRAARIARMMEKSDGDLLDRLKAYVESTTEPPAAAPAKAAAGKPAAKGKAKPKAAAKKAK
jgi:uncharacterized protein YndB with AHSA1/START domain